MRRQAGFTLIELLVVVSIIALLLAVLMPSLHRANRHARAVRCQANLRQWGTAFSAYVADSSSGTLALGFTADWPTRMRPYYADSNDLRLCPMAAKCDDPLARPQLGSAHRAWGNAASSGSYGLNGWFRSATPETSDAERYWNYGPTAEAGSQNAPFLLDCIASHASPDAFDEPLEEEGVPPYNFMQCFLINRHDGHINGLLRNWSVNKIGLKELWTLKWHKQYNTAGPWTRAGGARAEDWPAWMRRFKDY